MTATPSDNRIALRRSSLYAVMVEIGDRRIVGKVRDHSDTGCRIALDQPLRVDDHVVTVMRGDHRATGQIAWRDGRLAGIAFPKPPPEGMFSPSQTMSTSRRRQQVSIAPRFRRPGLGKEAIDPHQAEYARLWVDGVLESRN